MQALRRVAAAALLMAVQCGGAEAQTASDEITPPIAAPKNGSVQLDATQPEAPPEDQPALEATAVEADPIVAVPVVIGTAVVAGTYYPAGGAICSLVNQRQLEAGLRCLVEPTEGSAENLSRLREGTLDLAIVQSDWQYHAAAGSVGDGQPPFSELRSLFVLQPQAMTLVAGFDSGIATPEDMGGKRIGIGPADSGVGESARRYLEAVESATAPVLVEMPVERDVAALCAREIDAFLLPVAHPNGAVAEAVETCGATVVDLKGPAMDRLMGTWPYYVRARLPASLYATQPNDIESYGVAATVVTTSALPDDTAYAITQAIFEGLEGLREQHPTLGLITAESLRGEGMSAPLHPGALRYFQEQGWR